MHQETHRIFSTTFTLSVFQRHRLESVNFPDLPISTAVIMDYSAAHKPQSPDAVRFQGGNPAQAEIVEVRCITSLTRHSLIVLESSYVFVVVFKEFDVFFFVYRSRAEYHSNMFHNQFITFSFCQPIMQISSNLTNRQTGCETI
ncbi:hypothetical protein BaRGS_00015248 [Batillaria attramentaria]|uniref:Uncharacterized protein n=1 Tax=Batillaria attramentaria TaxID=370345 RepID=A0ABD0L2C2_9CAEN